MSAPIDHADERDERLGEVLRAYLSPAGDLGFKEVVLLRAAGRLHRRRAAAAAAGGWWGWLAAWARPGLAAAALALVAALATRVGVEARSPDSGVSEAAEPTLDSAVFGAMTGPGIVLIAALGTQVNGR